MLMDIEPLRRFANTLIGMTVHNGGRAADMAMFDFGDEQSVLKLPKHPDRSVPRFFLHIQSPWRIVGPDGIVVGSWDLWAPATPEAEASFDRDVPRPSPPDPSIRDLRLAELFDGKPARILESVYINEVADLTLRFDDGLRLEAFCIATVEDDEDYRWSDTEGQTFVVEGGRLDILEPRHATFSNVERRGG
jgi:hypothetical protein